ncbi:MAG: glycosyltransferase family 39 protein [Putridiphycobacter sp.]|nr:glycosyltransferase family 39 protein [Putridiphycobacter sp.]
MNKLKHLFQIHPLKSILIFGLVVRLIAVIFSSGFAMQDDHFLIIETPWAWSHGYEYNNWLPWDQDTETPKAQGHSLFYPSLHYVYFEICNVLGIENPKLQMLGVRLIHGLLSLLIVLLSYRITLKLSNQKTANIVGLSLALGWAMPFFGVRNLVEMVCIPPLLYGLWVLIKNDFKTSWKLYLVVGIYFGIAFSVRLQLAVFYAGFGACLLVMQQWKGSIALLLGFVLGAFLSQGIIDWYLWGYPFAELMEYINYNSSDAMFDYGGTWQWYKYVLVLVVFTIPIIGLFWLFGAFVVAKKYFYLFVPLVIFTLFHTLYPNQQERFIFPMIPIFVILGAIGWDSYRHQRQFWLNRPKLWSRIFGIAFGLNIVVLLLASTYATKQAKVNSAYYFYGHQKNKPLVIMQEDSFGSDQFYEGGCALFTKFYTGNGQIYSFIINNQTAREAWEKGGKQPDFILLNGGLRLDQRLEYFHQFYPNLEIRAIYKSSAIDRFLHYMNPKNKNEMVTVVKTNYARNK